MISDYGPINRLVALRPPKGDLVVEEKIDGFQLSFRRNGSILEVRSKNRDMLDVQDETDPFWPAFVVLRGLEKNLSEGVTYRTEFLSEPRMVDIEYARTPTMLMVLLDVERNGGLLGRTARNQEAKRLGLEVPPGIEYSGAVTVPVAQQFASGLKPLLGGRRLEGVVIKDYQAGKMWKWRF